MWNQIAAGWVFFVVTMVLLVVCWGLCDRRGCNEYYTGLFFGSAARLAIFVSLLIVCAGTWRLTRRFGRLVVRCCFFLAAVGLQVLFGVFWFWACILLYFACAGHGM